MNQGLLVPGIVLGFAVVFPLMWGGVVGPISLIGGWSSLARRFRYDSPPPGGRRRSSLSACVGWSNYKFTLNVTTANEGLYLTVHPLFRPFHPPLLIPWAEVRDLKPVESGYLRLFGFKSRLKVGKTWVTLTLPVEELRPPAPA